MYRQCLFLEGMYRATRHQPWNVLDRHFGCPTPPEHRYTIRYHWDMANCHSQIEWDCRPLERQLLVQVRTAGREKEYRRSTLPPTNTAPAGRYLEDEFLFSGVLVGVSGLGIHTMSESCKVRACSAGTNALAASMSEANDFLDRGSCCFLRFWLVNFIRPLVDISWLWVKTVGIPFWGR